MAPDYHDFRCTGQPDVTIHLHSAGIPQRPFSEKELTFDSGTLWSLYRQGAQNVFVLRAIPAGGQPYCVAVFDSAFTHGDIYSEPVSDGHLASPLQYPLSEVLMVCLLAQGRGLMVHACGIRDGERGYLFAGNSTHGKSTMARLWKDHAVVLNDDRIVLRYREGRCWMYGTPWHGDYDGVSPQGIPLDALFFLRHGADNEIALQNPVAAATMLLTRCFPPLWDATGMQFTLDFCARVVEGVPCYELGFVPDDRVIDFVRCVK